jgi:cytochrome P450
MTIVDVYLLSFLQNSNLATALCILPLLLGWLLVPRRRYTSANVLRVGKSQLQAWLTWDSLPQFSIGKYVTEGYYKLHKPTGTPFAIPMCGLENVILPPQYLQTLKGEERTDLSLCQAFEDVSATHPISSAAPSIAEQSHLDIDEQMFNMTATTGTAGRHDTVEIEVVAKYINPRLSALLPHMVAQTQFAFDHVVGNAVSWKKFSTANFAFDLVFAETARVLVGEDLCRNPAYLKSIVEYSKSFLMSGFMWPVRPPNWGFVRRWFYWLGTWGLRRDIARVFEFLLPVIDRRMALLGQLAGEQPDERYMDMITGLLTMNIPEPEEATPIRHAHRVLHISFAASAVSSALMMHMLHNVLMMPSIIPELRKDVQTALDEHGGWSEQAVIEMPLLDSFIRELLRLHPPSVCKCFLCRKTQRALCAKPVHSHRPAHRHFKGIPLLATPVTATGLSYRLSDL